MRARPLLIALTLGLVVATPAAASHKKAKPAPPAAAPAPAAAAAASDDDSAASASTAPAANADDAPAAPPASKKKHHASIDDDDAPAAAAAPAPAPASDDSADEAPPPKHAHASIDDDVDAPTKAKTAADKLRHSFAISGAVDGNLWHYSLTGTSSSSANAPLFPGASALVDAWPLAFAGVHWLGVDGDVAVGKADIALGSGFTPQEFTADTLRYGAALKLRYTFDNGIGIGPRVGYRFVTAGAVDENTAGAGSKRITVAPGTVARALAVGADAFVPFMVADIRVELEGRAEVLPLTTYQETPDNPGATSTAIGWHGLLGARVASSSGLFIEDRIETTGFRATFTDRGTRQSLSGSQAVTLNGGSAVNASASFSMGIGYLF